jgi:radical SAM protein with 4Fe4S-binding SPASM domain
MLDIKLKLKPGHTGERAWMEPSPLRTLFWNVTYACNYGCPICFTDGGSAHPDELTTGEALEAVQKAAEAGVGDILISGGEPFQRKDLLEILACMAKFGITARIASNGSLLTDEILSRLRRETLTKSFQISLDTINPVAFAEFHRVPIGALHQVLEALRLIKGHGFHTTVSVRMTPLTLPEIPRILDLAEREEWSTVTIHCPLHTRRISESFQQDEDVLSLLGPALEMFCANRQHWLIETYIPWAEYHPVIRRLEKSIRIIHRGCRAGRDRLTINPTGWLSPCVCMDLPEAYVGNIRTDSLTDVFQDSPTCDLFRHPEKYGICEGCPNLMRCGGGCRAAAFALCGRLDGQDESCPMWKRKDAQRASVLRMAGERL